MQHTSMREAVNDYMPTRELQYQFMLRKGWHLPKLKTSLVTIEFLHQVFEGRIWLPKQSEVSIVQLATPPPNEILRELLLNALDEKGATNRGMHRLRKELEKKQKSGEGNTNEEEKKAPEVP